MYNTSGTYLTSCVLNPSDRIEFESMQGKITTNKFFADVSTYYFDTEIKAEAFYLCGVLNSKFIDTKIKPLQPRGDFGPRSIHKLPFDFPIPKFESNNKYHKKISEISLECHRKASKELDGLSSYKSIGVLRSKIRDYLNEELAQIDECVKTIMED